MRRKRCFHFQRALAVDLFLLGAPDATVIGAEGSITKAHLAALASAGLECKDAQRVDNGQIQPLPLLYVDLPSVPSWGSLWYASTKQKVIEPNTPSGTRECGFFSNIRGLMRSLESQSLSPMVVFNWGEEWANYGLLFGLQRFLQAWQIDPARVIFLHLNVRN